MFYRLVILFFCTILLFSCNDRKENELKEELKSKMTNYPGFYIDSIDIKEKSIRFFISDTIDYVYPPYQTEFLDYYFNSVRKSLISFDQIGLNYRMEKRTHSWDEYPFVPSKRLLGAYSIKSKSPAYMKAMELIFTMENRDEIASLCINLGDVVGDDNVFLPTKGSIYSFLIKYYLDKEGNKDTMEKLEQKLRKLDMNRKHNRATVTLFEDLKNLAVTF